VCVATLPAESLQYAGDWLGRIFYYPEQFPEDLRQGGAGFLHALLLRRREEPLA